VALMADASDRQPYHLKHTGFEAPLGMLFEGDLVPGRTRSGPAFMRDEGHRLIVGPVGSGKFWAAICPLLLTVDRSSVVVYDVAGGEAARETRLHRGKLGPILLLDPYRLHSDGSDALNPMELLGKDDGGMLGRARSLAGAIMLAQRSGGDNDYFIGQAEDFLVALLIHVWTSPKEPERTLARVRAIIRRPLSELALEASQDGKPVNVAMSLGLLADMSDNPAARGYVQDAAENIFEDEAKTKGKNNFYVRQTLRENTSFLDDPNVQRVTARTTLDLRELRDGVATLYVITPAAELKQLGRWLRLVYSVLVPAMQLPVDAARHDARKDSDDHTPLHIVLDEFAAFGRFERVADDMATVRKFGIQYHIAVQKISQLKRAYGDGWEIFMPRYIHLLGSDEQTTAEAISQRIGTTIINQTSTSHTRQAGGGSHGTSVAPHTVRFLEPHQINGMEPDRSLAVIQGSSRPLLLRKWFAYADPQLIERRGKAQLAGTGQGAPRPSPDMPRVTYGGSSTYRFNRGL
jgi:type IV secretion system protein VirD4